MKTRQFVSFAAAGTLFLSLSVATAQAQTTATEYKPTVGQEGKDVVWVPTAQALVDRMLDMAKATPKDYVIDLGSGDGRTVITAAKRGINALGIEFNPDLVVLSRRNAAAEGVSERAQFIEGDIFKSDFSKATVLTLFLLPDLNVRLRPTILEMKPGTRVASNTFHMGDWEADDRVEAGNECTNFCRAYLWIVPAKVDGEWKLPQGRLVLNQKYQTFTGTLTLSGKDVPITDGRLNGEAITFTVNGGKVNGRVNGSSMELNGDTASQLTNAKATRS